MYTLTRYLILKKFGIINRWHPLLAFCNITFNEEIHCKGDRSPGIVMSAPADPLLPGEKVLTLMKRIRKYTNSIAITGGEPLTHPDFPYIIERVRKLRFKNIILTTNGYYIEQDIARIVPSVDHIIVSLDTLDKEKSKLYAGKNGELRTVLANLDRLATYPGRNYRITISSTIRPDNIDDIYEVYRYSQKKGFEFSAAPCFSNGKIDEQLICSSSYRELLNFLISEKLRGAEVYGTLRYLQCMKRPKMFRFYPFTTMSVLPDGSVSSPYISKPQTMVNLLEEGQPAFAYKKNFTNKIPVGECTGRCFPAQTILFSLLVDHPSDYIYEAWLRTKGKIIKKTMHIYNL